MQHKLKGFRRLQHLNNNQVVVHFDNGSLFQSYDSVIAMNQIEQAKTTLKQEGYAIENLWSTYDVDSTLIEHGFKTSEVTSDTKLSILKRCLENEDIIVQIQNLIETEIKNL